MTTTHALLKPLAGVLGCAAAPPPFLLRRPMLPPRSHRRDLRAGGAPVATTWRLCRCPALEQQISWLRLSSKTPISGG